MKAYIHNTPAALTTKKSFRLDAATPGTHQKFAAR